MSATLPSDHVLRAPTASDAEGVLRVLLARDVADIGYPDFTLEDLQADWATPGLGSALRDLAEARGRERGTAVLRQFVPVGNEEAAALLLDAGWWPAQHYLRMRIDLEQWQPVAADGLRPFERDQDELEVHQLVQTTLGEVEG